MMAGATLMLDAGLLRGRELWWMVLVGLGSYLAYVPFGTALFEPENKQLIFYHRARFYEK